MEGLGQFADLRGARQEKGGDIFERQADTPMHTMSSNVNHCILSFVFGSELTGKGWISMPN